MASLPLVERELRVALRKLNPARRRLRSAAWAVGIVSLLVLLAALTGARELAASVHTVVLIFALTTLASIPGRVAGAIAEERRNGTLGILFISGLSAMDIFIGKLFSAVLIAFNDLLVIFPMLALPFLMGGVSFELFIATVCCLPNLLLFILAVSLFASTVTTEEAGAQTWTTVLLLAICGLAPAIWIGQKWFAGAAVQSPWLAISPAYGVYLVFTKFSGATAHAFWVNSLMTLGWSAALFATAAGLLQRIWRNQENDAHSIRSSRLTRLSGKLFNRQRDASRWMIESNPALWAEIADTRPLRLAWLAIGAVLGLWLVGCTAWPAEWPSAANFFITTTLLIGIVQTIQHHATAKRFATARRDGAFELLLTTPLSVAELVEGHIEGRRLQFRSVVFGLLALELFMAAAGLVIRPWTAPALVTYSAVWLVLALWTWNLRGGGASTARVAWMALNSARVNFAVWGKSNGFQWFYIVWGVWSFSRGIGSLNSFPSGSTLEVVIACFIALVVLLIDIAQRREPVLQLARLITEFREIIREPIPDPDDPRYAKWTTPQTERFPWGTAGFQDQVIERNARRRAEKARSR